ncbi:unnamed protein product [Notodromas monacha]|uniref:Uncharacterized protein n=1 Tax=Notodromas monacha TaxID=399045 RepID=A0A7R9BQB2_9CRUS|nr:unnamed protein product [Notodromas monacha]CAG0919489.1 unnamed protein product [Notodromas monacha]
MSANFLFNAAWLILWDRELIHAASGCLWAMTICSLAAASFNYLRVYKQGFDLNLYKPSELWLNRLLVQNGLEVYVTWTLIASFVNSVVAVQYPPQGYTAADPKMAALIALAVLAGLFVLWFPFEISVFDKYCRYAVTQYAVIPFAMGGIYARKDTINIPEIEYLVLAFGIAGLAMLLIKLFLLVYRSKHNPLFPPIRG